MLLIETVLWVVAIVLAIPSLWFMLECLLGAWYRPREPQAGASRGQRVAILMPAHNESAGITRTIDALRPQLGGGVELWVVADNCSDDTAALARQGGARVLERHDTTRRGKGYALAHGIDHLAQDPPAAVIIFDADCEVSPGGVARLADQALTTGLPAQADYSLAPAAQPSPKSVVSALAFLVKNRVRPRGLDAMGFPCLLTGTGMAFPWAVLRQAPPTNDHLVEDMVMGLELAKMGYPPRICPQARVISALPDGDKAASTQRTRWEHGHLATMMSHAPSLLATGVAKFKPGLVALALELAVPPLSLLVMLVVLGAAVAGIAALLGAGVGPFALLAVSLLGITAGVLLGWRACGQDLLKGRDLIAIPMYLVWKLPLYLGFFARRRQQAWVRTERTPAAGGSDTPKQP